MDLAVLSACSPGVGFQVAFLHGNGDGTFVTSHSVAVGAAKGLITADFNLDGYPDVAVVTFLDKVISILAGGPGGPTAINYLVLAQSGLAPLSAVFADWNLDGYADLAVAVPGYIQLFENDKTPSGGFIVRGQFPVGSNPQQVVAADLNGDSWTDFLTSNGGEDSFSVVFMPPVP